jgi:hypothetical protein
MVVAKEKLVQVSNLTVNLVQPFKVGRPRNGVILRIVLWLIDLQCPGIAGFQQRIAMHE